MLYVRIIIKKSLKFIDVCDDAILFGRKVTIFPKKLSMELHHVKCQKTTIFVADHCETTRTCENFPGRVYVLFRGLFCIHLSTGTAAHRHPSQK
jgi:hypothetical protein